MTKLGRTLQPGDLIVVAYNNSLYPAIFDSLGPKSNPRFWMVSNLKWVKDRAGLGQSFHRNFINRISHTSIAKLDVNELGQQDRDDYEELLDILKKAGKI